MKEQDLIREAKEIAKQIIREGKVTGSTDVLESVPELLTSVVIDRAYIKACIERELNRATGNPINALLKLVGLRIVCTKKEINNLSESLTAGSEVELRQTGEGNFASFLMLDGDRLRAGLTEMAEKLSNAEIERRREREAERSQYNLAHDELTRAASQAAQLTVDYADIRKTVAERVQYMLSLSGPSGDEMDMTAQLMELLDDLDMTAYWNAGDAPFTEGAMFSTLKVPDLTGRRPRPCIVCGGAVLAKGLKFVAEPASQRTEEEPEADAPAN